VLDACFIETLLGKKSSLIACACIKWEEHSNVFILFAEISLSPNPGIDKIPKSLYGAFKHYLRKIYTRDRGIPLKCKSMDMRLPLRWGVVEKVGDEPR